MEKTSVTLTHAAVDEDGAEIIVRGVLDPGSLERLRVAEYQREILPDRKIGALMQALQSGGVPDIQLGCRGGNFIERDGSVHIQDAVYIIDGLQRRTAAMKLLDKGVLPHLGAVVSFNTTEELERKRFRALNVTRVKLSPNVLMRNLRHESVAIQALHQLSSMSNFALYRRVCWQQRMRREELLSAMTLLHTICVLHARFGASLTERSMPRLVRGIDAVYNKIGRANFLGNIREYWSVVDGVFNIHDVVYKDATIVLRMGFLLALSRVFSRYQDFWNDTEFSVPAELKKKLASFPVTDPSIRVLATSTGQGIAHLANLIVEHLNSGKRTKRLRPFPDTPGKYEDFTKKTESDEEAEEN